MKIQKFNLPTFIFFTAITIFFQQLKAEQPYSPNAKIIGKFSHTRSIAQVAVLIPLLQKLNNLLYIPAIGMLDLNSANEINIGIGYRQIINSSYILGTYSFFDYRKSQHNNFFKQITIGLELFTQNFEFRANLYLPEQKTKISYSKKMKDASVKYDGIYTNYTFSEYQYQYTETPDYGGDTEIGFAPGIQSNFYLAYYHFFNTKNNSKIHGLRTRATYQQNSLLTYDAEISFDNVRKLSGFIGFSLSFTQNHPSNIIHKKMTSLPVRDIDIVIDSIRTNLVTEKTRKHLGFVPLVDLEIYTQNGLGGHEEQENIFSSTRAMNTIAKNVEDVLVYHDGEFTLLSELKAQLLEPDSPLVREFNRLYSPILKKHSPLHRTFEGGFWTSNTYKNTIEKQYTRLKNTFPNININMTKYNQILKNGVLNTTTDKILEFYISNLNNSNDIKFIKHSKNSDTDPISENVTNLKNEINKNVALLKHDHRYFAGKFSMENHATALIIDRQNNMIYFIDSNHRKLSNKQKTILKQSFGNGYQFNSSLKVPRQRESWSCAQHTVQNIMDFFEGNLQKNIVGSNRDMQTILKKNLYWYEAANLYG